MNRFDWAYLAACVPAAPVLGFRFVVDPRYRHRITERFGWFKAEDGLRSPAWFHAASVGEVNAAQPLIEAFHRAEPDVPLVMTTMTLTGRERAGRIRGVARFRYAPFDFEVCVEEAFRRWRPRMLVVVEHELWPNLFLGAARHGVPVVVVNARLSERSLTRYRHLGRSLDPVVRAVTRVLAQDDGSARRWRALGAASVETAGNLKFDAEAPAVDAAALRRELRIPADATVVVGGSTHAPEEEWLLRATAGKTLVLAPRYLERVVEVEKLIEKSGRRDVVLVKRMGMLRQLYAIADVAFVGGSVAPKGGHNLLEPAICGRPIVAGPGLDNTREIADALIAAGALRVVESPEALAAAIDAADAAQGEAARAVATRGAGAVARHVEGLRALLAQKSERN